MRMSQVQKQGPLLRGLALGMGLFLLTGGVLGCGPTREATSAVADVPAGTAATAPVSQTPETTPEPATPAPTTAALIEFWTTDQQPERIAAYEAVAARFMAAYPGVEVSVVGKDEATISAELLAAAEAGTLPALVRLGVERLPELSVAGLLDEQAASAVIRSVGIDDFRAGPLEMVTNLESQQQWAIPYDGWIQAMWYRKDLFDAQALAAPATWEQINAACDALVDAPAVDPALRYALALPSDPMQNYVHQVFEQIAIANQAWPLTGEGDPAFTTPEMVEALSFYAGLQRCAAPAPLNVTQAADHYLRGEVAMLFYSTYIMDDLVEGASRADGSTLMPAFDDLAGRTSFAAGMVGPRGSAAYGQIVALALLQGADPLAREVAKFYLTDGYLEILATAPLGKVPMRHSTAQHWTELSPVFANYSAATLGHIANSFDSANRWVLRSDYNNVQRAVISEIEGRLLIPQAAARMLSGEWTPEEAAEWLQAETSTLTAAQE